MGALRMLLRASFRHRWRSWLALGLLVALVSGLVLTAVVAGRRATAAYPDYQAAHGYDAFLYSVKPLPKVTTLPGVALITPVEFPIGGNVTCACTRPINSDYFSVFEVAPNQLTNLVKLESGRMPDPSDPDQVLASFTLAQDNGVHIGTVIHVPFAAPSQRATVLSGGRLTPRGPTVTLHVVGIEASETEFPAGGSPSLDLYTTPAFARAVNLKTVVLHAYYVRLHGGAAALGRFETQATAIGGLSVTVLENEASAIELSIHPQAVGWWILAGLAALVGIVTVAQALARQATVEADTSAIVRSLGVSRRQLVGLPMARTLLIAVFGALGGVALAFVLSPLTVVGEVKLADPSSGFAFDAPALVLGALATILAILVVGLWPAMHTSAHSRARISTPVVRPSRVVSALVAAGAPPSTLIGVRHALERGRGRTAIPVGSALFGAIVAVTALCATVVFGASLTHLTSTPSLYGQPFNEWFSVNQTGSTAQNAAVVRSLERKPARSCAGHGDQWAPPGW